MLILNIYIERIHNNINMADEEEYEVIQTSPLRRLEKRINKMEDSSSSSEVRRLIEQIIELKTL